MYCNFRLFIVVFLIPRQPQNQRFILMELGFFDTSNEKDAFTS